MSLKYSKEKKNKKNQKTTQTTNFDLNMSKFAITFILSGTFIHDI